MLAYGLNSRSLQLLVITITVRNPVKTNISGNDNRLEQLGKEGEQMTERANMKKMTPKRLCKKVNDRIN